MELKIKYIPFDKYIPPHRLFLNLQSGDFCLEDEMTGELFSLRGKVEILDNNKRVVVGCPDPEYQIIVNSDFTLFEEIAKMQKC